MTRLEEQQPQLAVGRRLAGLGYYGLLGVTAFSDALPARIRFGRWASLLSLLRVRNGPAVVPRSAETTGAPAHEPSNPLRRAADEALGDARCQCMLIAGALDGGGVETVISSLALGLPRHGILPEVVATKEGRISAQLRRAGVRVTTCPVGSLAGLIAERRPDVLELHRPDPQFVTAVHGSPAPVVPVFHAMESYLSPATWAAIDAMVAEAAACIAVSDGVREFLQQHTTSARVSVVVNGVPRPQASGGPSREAAREDVGRAIGTRIGDDEILVVGLQRYSDQKNASGLVDAFLLAARQDPRLRLVLAGTVDNWLEYRRADLLARSSPAGPRVHLLGDSDPTVILAAADVYALDSFAEGGPLTAIEAASHGLPMVLSQVGFTSELVADPAVVGEVVARANSGFDEADLAAQRRRRHQSNQDAFAAALLRVSRRGRGARGTLPSRFTSEAMVAGHAAVLRSACEH